jgi:hypothetical protein
MRVPGGNRAASKRTCFELHTLKFIAEGDSGLFIAPGDEGTYPDDDLEAVLVEGLWRFFHKNGAPY